MIILVADTDKEEAPCSRASWPRRRWRAGVATGGGLEEAASAADDQYERRQHVRRTIPIFEDPEVVWLVISGSGPPLVSGPTQASVTARRVSAQRYPHRVATSKTGPPDPEHLAWSASGGILVATRFVAVGIIAPRRGRNERQGPRRIEVAALVDSVRTTNQRPRQYDAKLLAISRVTLGTDLDSSQKSKVRAAFLSALDDRLKAPPGAPESNAAGQPPPQATPRSTAEG